MIHVPPKYKDIEGPLIFLAGPIQGAPDWQSEAIAHFKEIDPKLHIASPRRPRLGDPGEFTDNLYNEQVDWEHHHLATAVSYGVVMFWLAAEVERHPGRAYAQTTRFELGEAVALNYLKGAPLVVGIEEGFSGARYIRRTLAAKTKVKPIINLRDTCEAAAVQAQLAALAVIKQYS